MCSICYHGDIARLKDTFITFKTLALGSTYLTNLLILLCNTPLWKEDRIQRLISGESNGWWRSRMPMAQHREDREDNEEKCWRESQEIVKYDSLNCNKETQEQCVFTLNTFQSSQNVCDYWIQTLNTDKFTRICCWIMSANPINWTCCGKNQIEEIHKSFFLFLISLWCIPLTYFMTFYVIFNFSHSSSGSMEGHVCRMIHPFGPTSLQDRWPYIFADIIPEEETLQPWYSSYGSPECSSTTIIRWKMFVCPILWFNSPIF